MIKRNRRKTFISLLLTFSIMFSSVACSSTASNPTSSGSNSKGIGENVKTEDIRIEDTRTEDICIEDTVIENTITETVLLELITNEKYLEEKIIIEEKISELLLEEETITEVMLCKSIYVPQDNIDEFSEKDQAIQLFGNEVDISALLKKVSIGTGIIITVVVLKKAELSYPISSVVFGAADESLGALGKETVIDSLLEGLIGAADKIDESGRISAAIGFATATVGLILSIVSLVAEVPSGGSTAITVAAGVKLVIAAVSVLSAMKETADAGLQAVKTFTATDLTDIDWDNIDWQKVGASSVERTIENATDEYMWGSIIGVVHGGAEGYEFYQQ